MKKLFLLCCILLLTQSITCQEFQDTIPFRNNLGLIIIPVSFNGKVKQFAFDTGAERTVSYSWASKELEATRKNLTVVSSSGKKSKMQFFKSGTITIGTRKITGHRILNTNSNSIFSCHNIDGILGVDIIKELNWKIDYKNKYLIMYPSEYIPYEVGNMYALDFDFKNNRPYIFINRKKSSFKLLLDTGAGGYSNISKKDYVLLGINDLPQKKVFSGSYDVNGIFTATSPLAIQFPVSSSNEVLIEPIFFYNNLKSSKVGNALWGKKELFLSLKEKILFISESTVVNRYEGYEASFSFRDNKIKVVKIVEGSNAWKLGLRQGSEIAKINGKTFLDFCSLDRYQRQLQKEKKPITITLLDGKTLSLKQETFIE